MTEDVNKTKEFLAEALKRFRLASEAESMVRRDALDDLKFSVGEQWDSTVRAQRQLDGRPCLVMNKLPQFVRQVVNEQRQQRPSPQVNPVGDGATTKTAEYLNGIIRHVETNSEGKAAYDHAFEMAVRVGFGYFRLTTDYADDKSFEQEIQIRRIKNPFSVYFDPNVEEPDYSDARWAFIVSDLAREVFEEQHGKDAAASLADFASVGDRASGWVTKEAIRVAEYFYVEEAPLKFYQLEGGGVVFSEQDIPQDAKVTAEREITIRKVKWAKISALDILEEGEWIGRWIPIIPVLGDDLDVDGKRHLAGLIRHAKDPQRVYNYWNSAAAEMIALAPKAPYIGAKGQFENQEEQWRSSNVKNFAYLEYTPMTVAGQPAPPPQRSAFEPPIQAMAQMMRQADEDLKGTTGIYSPMLGQPGMETSGRAILARQQQSQMAVANFADNLARSIRFCGRQLVDLIPKIYDTPRIQRIVNPDNTGEYIVIYRGQQQQQQAQQMTTEAIQKIFDVSVGRYDVTVTVGPSYATKRIEAATSMMEFIKVLPQSAMAVQDLIARNMDWPGAQEISDRLKKMLPPQLLEGEEGDPRIELQKTKAQMQQLMQQHELLTKALNDATQTIDRKKLDLESKERMNALDNQTKLIIEQLKTEREGALEMLRAQLATIGARLDLLGQEKPIGGNSAPVV